MRCDHYHQEDNHGIGYLSIYGPFVKSFFFFVNVALQVTQKILYFISQLNNIGLLLLLLLLLLLFLMSIWVIVWLQIYTFVVIVVNLCFSII